MAKPRVLVVILHCDDCPYCNVEYDNPQYSKETCSYLERELTHDIEKGVDSDCPLKTKEVVLLLQTTTADMESD